MQIASNFHRRFISIILQMFNNKISMQYTVEELCLEIPSRADINLSCIIKQVSYNDSVLFYVQQ